MSRFMFWQGIQTKNFPRASRENLSLKIFKMFQTLTLYVLARYSDQNFPRASRESLSLRYSDNTSREDMYVRYSDNTSRETCM